MDPCPRPVSGLSSALGSATSEVDLTVRGAGKGAHFSWGAPGREADEVPESSHEHEVYLEIAQMSLVEGNPRV